MPKTANYIAKKRKYKITSSLLFIPEKNLTVGQDYLEYLLSNRKIKGNLFYMAAAYNAGPNKLSRWVKKVKHGNDPLLFIESIPSKETRDFIERIMSNYWIYRERLGFETPSINSILSGEWPIYKLEEKRKNKTHKVADLLGGTCHARSIS
jgi:soluble lytic murein transglycosylase-like protein